MSELKAFRIIQGDTGGYGAPSYKCDADGNQIEEWPDVCEVYDKSEADKVIANLIKDEQKAKADKLLSCLKDLVMRDLIKDCPSKKVATKIVKEYDAW